MYLENGAKCSDVPTNDHTGRQGNPSPGFVTWITHVQKHATAQQNMF